MHRATSTLGTIAVFFAMTNYAWADWNYTRWGMTPDQVVKASKGSVHRFDGVAAGEGGPVEHARGVVPVGNGSMSASFYFDSTGLREIVLTSPYVTVCGSAVDELNGKYGQVTGSGRMGMDYAWARWRATESNLWVDLNSMPDGCRVQYTPLVTNAGEGL